LGFLLTLVDVTRRRNHLNLHAMKTYASRYALFFALLLTPALIRSAAAQTCYPTSLINASLGTSIAATYDDQHNLTAVAIKAGQMQTAYTVTTEKTATGYRRIFTLGKVDSATAAFSLSKTIATYDKNNRLMLVEGKSTSMRATEKYMYNASNQLVQIDEENFFKDAAGKESLADQGQRVYQYPNAITKNPSEIKVYGILNNEPGLKLLEHYVLTYDNQRAVSDEFPFSAGPIRAFSANNILTADITYVSAKTNVKQSYKYTFNANGYPISKTYKFSGDDTTDMYSYDCK